MLDVKAEMHDIPIMHHILLPFQAHLARFLGALLAFESYELIIGDDFGPDEAFLKIGMDDSGRFGCSVSYVDGPRAHFFRRR